MSKTEVKVGAALIATAKESESNYEEVVVEEVTISSHNKKRDEGGKSETSADHLGVKFNLGGKTYYRTVFQKNCDLERGHYAKARVTVAPTDDEYVFRLTSVIKDANIMTKPELAATRIVALDF